MTASFRKMLTRILGPVCRYCGQTVEREHLLTRAECEIARLKYQNLKLRRSGRPRWFFRN